MKRTRSLRSSVGLEGTALFGLHSHHKATSERFLAEDELDLFRSSGGSDFFQTLLRTEGDLDATDDARNCGSRFAAAQWAFFLPRLVGGDELMMSGSEVFGRRSLKHLLALATAKQEFAALIIECLVRFRRE